MHQVNLKHNASKLQTFFLQISCTTSSVQRNRFPKYNVLNLLIGQNKEFSDKSSVIRLNVACYTTTVGMGSMVCYTDYYNYFWCITVNAWMPVPTKCVFRQGKTTNNALSCPLYPLPVIIIIHKNKTTILLAVMEKS